MEGSFVAEDIHLPHVYVDRVVLGHSYEKRIEVRKSQTVKSLKNPLNKDTTELYKEHYCCPILMHYHLGVRDTSE